MAAGMTEARWREGASLTEMLAFVRKHSARKARLFACASCRLIWHFMTDDRARQAVELAEAWADGLLSEEAFSASASEARQAHYALDPLGDEVTEGAHRAAKWIASPGDSAVLAVGSLVRTTLSYAQGKDADRREAGRHAAGVTQIQLLREIVGNPFSVPPLEPAWLSWESGRLVHLAQTIYEQRAYHQLPLLADLLEEAGCTEATLLDHCRQTEPHVLGCWVLDLLLQKE